MHNQRREVDCPKCGGNWYADLDEEGKPYTCFYCCNGNIRFYMKKYAVAYISFFDNELNIEFVEALSVVDAFAAHSKCGDMVQGFREVRAENEADLEIPWTEEEDLKHLKNYCWNADAMVDIKELPAGSTVRLEA